MPSGPIPSPPAPARASPIDVVDAVLGAALRADCDMVWLEPMPMAGDRYLITFERQGRVVATATPDTQLATAVIARLAIIFDLDLMGRRAATGCVHVSAGGARGEVVMTLRPGTAMRAELLFVRREKPRIALAGKEVHLAPGDRVDHYKVVEHMGAGGMGAVYRVTHVTLGCQFALKVLHGNVLARDADAAGQFLREARAAARVKHPNIVDVFDFGHLADGRPYFVMELLPGQSLGDLVDRGPVEPRRAVVIARQLASALMAAHERGVIHADISPSNVLLVDTEAGPAVKLVDFGLAQLRDDDLTAAAGDDPDYVLGTPSYIAPEQIRGLGAEEASDQYSLGAILFEMIHGKPPYQAPTLHELCMLHIKGPIPEPASPYGPVPKPLIDVIATCLAKRPADRFPDMRALAAALDDVDRGLYRKGWRRWLPS
ncbi:MAG: serine/threonine protein kinase [Kofleriaceae bacterium]|nr:serine/threonine protein kinase [Kofleriaceae bacterium]MBP6835825.1 serine/threonine protein kinase [Kofleriaceae bacterium]MBP9206930.1 serine/threonine protein kinase [Kofleriaceae bacterium]